MISSSASLAIVLRDSSDTLLMLLRFAIVRVPDPARFKFAPFPLLLGNTPWLPGGDPGDLAPVPTGRGPRERRGPRRPVAPPVAPVMLFDGDGLREPPGAVTRGELERRRDAGTAVAVTGLGAGRSSAGGSAKCAGRAGGGVSGSGGGSLNCGRGGRSSVSGGGSLNVGTPGGRVGAGAGAGGGGVAA